MAWVGLGPLRMEPAVRVRNNIDWLLTAVLSSRLNVM